MRLSIPEFSAVAEWDLVDSKIMYILITYLLRVIVYIRTKEQERCAFFLSPATRNQATRSFVLISKTNSPK